MIVMTMQKAGGLPHLQSLCFEIRTQASKYLLAGEATPEVTPQHKSSTDMSSSVSHYVLHWWPSKCRSSPCYCLQFYQNTFFCQFAWQWNDACTYTPTGLKIHYERKLLSNIIVLFFVFGSTVLGLQDRLLPVIPWCSLTFCLLKNKMCMSSSLNRSFTMLKYESG